MGLGFLHLGTRLLAEGFLHVASTWGYQCICLAPCVPKGPQVTVLQVKECTELCCRSFNTKS